MRAVTVSKRQYCAESEQAAQWSCRKCHQWECAVVLTCKDHSHLQALLEAAVLAPVPLHLVDFTLSIRHACIHPFVLHCALEETLAPENSNPLFVIQMTKSATMPFLGMVISLSTKPLKVAYPIKSQALFSSSFRMSKNYRTRMRYW